MTAADLQRHLFGPEQQRLEQKLRDTEAMLAATTSDEAMLGVKLELADLYYFQVRELTCQCFFEAPRDPQKARACSERTHVAREKLADLSSTLLLAQPPKKLVVLLRLGLTQLALASFAEAASSFEQIISARQIHEFTPLARVGQAIALHYAEPNVPADLDSMKPPRSTTRSGRDFEYDAFGAARCLAGEWAEQEGRTSDARREYQTFLSWVEDNASYAAKQDALFRQQVEDNLASLGEVTPL